MWFILPQRTECTFCETGGRRHRQWEEKEDGGGRMKSGSTRGLIKIPGSTATVPCSWPGQMTWTVGKEVARRN